MTVQAVTDVLNETRGRPSWRGEFQLALEIYAFTMTFPFIANSQWYSKLVGEEMEAAATALSDEEVATAKERGQKRDFWATAAELLAIFQELG